ncbi:MAG: glycosyltransferase family 2 protein [Elusimicrobia bacterium]|nr:glycosyltransferase family 2 protein [Elusimicrobiota bacterium]
MTKRTIVLLTFNEIEAAPKVIGTIPKDAADEIIAVDGGSKDGTIDFLKSKGLRVVVQQERGRGIAFRLGAQEAKGEHVVFYSPDGNEDAKDIPRLFAALAEGYDMVIASRMMKGAFNEEDVHWWRPRKWVNQSFTLAANMLWNRGDYVTDTINGFRGVTKAAMTRMATDEKGFPIEYQMSIRAMKLGLKIKEIPTHEGQRVGGASTAESWPTGKRFVRKFLDEIAVGSSF